MRFPAERLKAQGPDAELALREWLAAMADRWARRHHERLRTHLLKSALKEGYALPLSNKHVREVTAATLGGRIDGHR